MSKSKQDIFKEIVLVNVDNAIWSGYKRTTEGDLVKMNATLPGGGIITKGGKKIYPTDTFTPFNSLKKEISRKLMSVGVSALGGSSRVIPNNQMQDVQAFLDESRQRFNSLLADFEAGYDANLEKHLNDITDPVVREIVERSTLSKAEAVKRFRFVTDVFNIVPQGEGDGLVNNLVNKLFNEVSTAARDAYEKSFLGKPRVGQRALNQVVAIRNKMAGLSVLDGQNIQPIVDTIDGTLNSMPTEGWIEGVNYSALIGLVNMLCEPEDMLKHAEKIQQGLASSIAPVVSATASEPVVPVVAEVEEVISQPEPQPVVAEEVVEVAPQPKPKLAAVAPKAIKAEPVVENEEVKSPSPQLTLIDTAEAKEVEAEKEDKPLPLVNTVPAPKPVKKAAAFF
jgi:hypothetical protein